MFPHRRAWLLAVLGTLLGVAACEEVSSPFDPDPPRNNIDALVISPSVDTLQSLADTVLFTLEAFDVFGAAMSTNGAMWSTSDNNVVQIDRGGLAVSRGNGAAIIRATLSNVSDSAVIFVSQRAVRVEATVAEDTIAAIGATVAVSAQAYDARGFPLAKGSVAWHSSDKTVAVVSANGVVTAVRNGSAFIVAAAGEALDSVSVTVRQLPTRIEVVPNIFVAHSIGDATQLIATTFDAGGHVMPVGSIQWSVSNPNVATVSPSGLVTAVANGTAYVKAQAEESRDSVRIDVDQLAVSLDLTPDVDTLDALGQTLNLEWAAHDARGHSVADRPSEWHASNPTVAHVNQGVVTSVGNGEVMLVARLDKAVDTVNILVQQTPVAMSLDPFSTAVREGDTLHLGVSLLDRNGHLMATDGIEWSVSDSSVGFVDQYGVLYTFSLGAVEIEVEVAGFTDVGTVTVQPLFSTFGLNFSPFLDGQDPSFVVGEQQIRDRVALIAPYTQWIRTFGCTGGLDMAGAIAREFGLQIAMGAWLGTDSASNEAELECLIQSATAGEVDIAIVGGEVLLRGDLSEAELIGYIQRAKAALPGIPVTYNDTHGQLLAHPAVIAEVDVVLANFYPYWDGTSIGDAIASLDESYKILQTASGGKTVMVGETGWPTCGDQIANAQPTPLNGARFFFDFQDWAQLNAVQSFYFSAYDEAWKTVNEGPQGACWGVWDSVGAMKLPKGVTS